MEFKINPKLLKVKIEVIRNKGMNEIYELKNEDK